MLRDIFQQSLFVNLKEKFLGTEEQPTALKLFPQELKEQTTQFLKRELPWQKTIQKYTLPETKEEERPRIFKSYGRE
jgi:superfamily I DNA and/or RNA helicase